METREIFKKACAEYDKFLNREGFKSYACLAEFLGEPFDEEEIAMFEGFIKELFARRNRIIDDVIVFGLRYEEKQNEGNQ